MTEEDLPFIVPPSDLPPDTNEIISPSPDVKNPLPDHEPIEKMEPLTFDCPICGKSFNTKTDLDLHMETVHKQTKKA